MHFISCGNKDGQPLLMVHGLASDARLCFGALAPEIKKDFRLILCELDGHSPRAPGEFQTLAACCEQIEAYADKDLRGAAFDALGFSLGATICLELVSRGRAPVRRLALDAPIIIRPQWMAARWRPSW